VTHCRLSIGHVRTGVGEAHAGTAGFLHRNGIIILAVGDEDAAWRVRKVKGDFVRHSSTPMGYSSGIGSRTTNRSPRWDNDFATAANSPLSGYSTMSGEACAAIIT
jgi:hypothetical protein